MQSKVINLLLTGAGTQTFGNVVRALRGQKGFRFRITACDMDPLAYGLYLAHKKYIIPKANSESFLSAVHKICLKEKIDVLIPLLSLEFPRFARARKYFAQIGVRMPISDPETIRICTDKKLTYDFFVKNEIPTPLSFVPETLPEKYPIPMIIKPRISSGTKNVWKVSGREELEKFMRIVPKPIIQEFIDGEEYTIDVLSDWNCDPIAVVPRLRLDTMEGKSVKGKTVDDKTLVLLAGKIIKKLKLIGPGNIQCFKTKDKYYVSEINPRFSAGGLPLTVAAGINTPLMLVKMALGGSMTHNLPYKKNLYMLRYLTEIFVEEKNIAHKNTQ